MRARSVEDPLGELLAIPFGAYDADPAAYEFSVSFSVGAGFVPLERVDVEESEHRVVVTLLLRRPPDSVEHAAALLLIEGDDARAKVVVRLTRPLGDRRLRDGSDARRPMPRRRARLGGLRQVATPSGEPVLWWREKAGNATDPDRPRPVFNSALQSTFEVHGAAFARGMVVVGGSHDWRFGTVESESLTFGEVVDTVRALQGDEVTVTTHPRDGSGIAITGVLGPTRVADRDEQMFSVSDLGYLTLRRSDYVSGLRWSVDDGVVWSVQIELSNLTIELTEP